MDKIKRTRRVSLETPDAPIKRVRRTKAQMQEARGVQAAEEPKLKASSAKVIGKLLTELITEHTQTGWLNIYYNTSPSGKCWYSTGGDIYDSVESARTHAQKGVLSQVQITYPLKRED